MNILVAIAAAAIFTAVLLWDLFTDHKKWVEEKTINHDKEGWQRVALLIPSIAGFTVAVHGQLFWTICLSVWLVGSWYWTLFDGFLNKMQGYKFFQVVGTTSRLDKFQQMIGETLSFLLKFTLAGASLIVYIVALIVL